MKPVIAITVDNRDNTATSNIYESTISYSRLVAQVGGVPVLLPHEPELAPRYATLFDGFIFTGGVDPVTEPFGEPTHPKARPIDPRRQAFELALYAALEEHPAKPVLGICLGMQLMALFRGGKLNQYLPDTLPTADAHKDRKRHGLVLTDADSVLSRLAPQGRTVRKVDLTVVSHHQQAVADPGTLRVIAHSPDGVIEAIDDPNRPFYVGVQWHPERGGPGPFNASLVAELVVHAAKARSQ